MVLPPAWRHRAAPRSAMWHVCSRAECPRGATAMQSARGARCGASSCWQQSDPGRRLVEVLMRAGLRDLDPAMHAVLTFLDHREINGGASRGRVLGNEAIDDELVVVRIGQI